MKHSHLLLFLCGFALFWTDTPVTLAAPATTEKAEFMSISTLPPALLPGKVQTIYRERYKRFWTWLKAKSSMSTSDRLREVPLPQLPNTPFATLQEETDFYLAHLIQKMGDAEKAIKEISKLSTQYTPSVGLIKTGFLQCDLRSLKNQITKALTEQKLLNPKLDVAPACSEGSRSSNFSKIFKHTPSFLAPEITTSVDRLLINWNAEFFDLVDAFRNEPRKQKVVREILALMVHAEGESARVNGHAADYHDVADDFIAAYNRCQVLLHPTHPLYDLYRGSSDGVSVSVVLSSGDRVRLTANQIHLKAKEQLAALSVVVAPSIPSIDAFTGLELGASLSGGVQRTNDKSAYYRLDKLGLNANITPGTLLDDLPVYFSTEVGTEILYVRRFANQMDAFKAIPFKLSGLPISCKGALKMHEGDFLGMPLKMSLAFGASASVTSAAMGPVAVGGSLGAIVEGKYAVQIFRLAGDRLRLRLILQGGQSGTVGATVKMSTSLTDISLLNTILKAGSSAVDINTTLASASATGFLSKSHVIDYVFDLSSPEACKAYEGILKSPMSMHKTMKDAFKKHKINLNLDYVADTSLAEQLHLQSQGQPPKKRPVIRVLAGEHVNHGGKINLGGSLLLVQGTLSRTENNNRFTIRKSDGSEKYYTFPTITLDQQSRWVAGWNGSKIRENAFSVFETDKEGKSMQFHSSGVSFDRKEDLLTPFELAAIRQRIVNLLPQRMEDQINWTDPWKEDYERHYSKYVRVMQPLLPQYNLGMIPMPTFRLPLKNISEEVDFFTQHVINHLQSHPQMTKNLDKTVADIKQASTKTKRKFQIGMNAKNFWKYNISDFAKNDARIFYQLLFHRQAYQHLQGITFEQLEKKLAAYLETVHGQWPTQFKMHKWDKITQAILAKQLHTLAYIFSTHEVKSEAKKATLFQQLFKSVNELDRAINRPTNRKEAAQVAKAQEREAYDERALSMMQLLKGTHVQDLWIGFILSLFPEDKLEEMITFNLKVTGTNAKPLDYTLGSFKEGDLYHSMYAIQAMLNDDSYVIDTNWTKREDGTFTDDLSKIETDDVYKDFI